MCLKEFKANKQTKSSFISKKNLLINELIKLLARRVLCENLLIGEFANKGTYLMQLGPLRPKNNLLISESCY